MNSGNSDFEWPLVPSPAVTAQLQCFSVYLAIPANSLLTMGKNLLDDDEEEQQDLSLKVNEGYAKRFEV